jgi:hypothetical protein
VSKCDVNGNLEYNTDGPIKKHKIPMQDSVLTDGTVQPLYFPEGHECAGVFKGMVIILEEQGFAGAQKLHAECKNFKCAPPALDCCCCPLLFNQLDFQDVNTILGAVCEACSFWLIFLPKFHCELNFIEQCCGYTKQLY